MAYGITPRDRTGERQGRLTMVRFSYRDPGPKGARYWIARCDCGQEVTVRPSTKSHSCGCLAVEWGRYGRSAVTHGLAGRNKVPEYQPWCSMKQRCLNSKNPAFKDYGGRGITICDKWMNDFPAFLADMGPRPSLKHSIHRMDNNRGYSPDNCTWATALEQASAKRAPTYPNGVHPNSLKNIQRSSAERAESARRMWRTTRAHQRRQ